LRRPHQVSDPSAQAALASAALDALEVPPAEGLAAAPGQVPPAEGLAAAPVGEDGPVIVIGAGAAGLAAARWARSQGAIVLVLEARERLGGRVCTERSPGDDVPHEMGANYIHGVDGNPLCGVADEAGATAIPFNWEEDPMVAVHQAHGGHPTNHFMTFIHDFYDFPLCNSHVFRAKREKSCIFTM